MNWMILFKSKLAFAALFLVAGCGTSGNVIMQNVRSAPTIVPATVQAGLVPALPPTELSMTPVFPPMVRTTRVPDMSPTELPVVKPTVASGHDGMIMPTQSVPVNSGSIPTESGFVLLWEMFGTPTGTPSSGQNSQVNPATTQIAQVNTQAPPATRVVASPTLSATATVLKPVGAPTLPPTTTKAVSSALTGDLTRGKTLFNGSAGCAGCHDTTQGMTISGPSLKGVASRATTRKPGMSATDYLHESIRQPNAYVVKGFTPGVMLQTYGQTLNNGQIDDLVAYLLTLK